MTELGRSLEVSVTAREGTAATTAARKLLDYLDHVDVVFQPSND
jgi:hypothetical protein